jgi:hypothetical protein
VVEAGAVVIVAGKSVIRGPEITDFPASIFPPSSPCRRGQ